ncbi:MAG: methylornithine synthase PylB, partial [Clostridiales Family XIII bacterium]|nr:methylornithine synthase PylB [Clostridiales Family XIII bacterium]
MMTKYTAAEIEELLTGDDKTREALFADAREARAAHFGKGIFLYGFVYHSTYCKNNCEFCYYRRDNAIERYRKSAQEVTETAERLVKSGVSLIDLTTGDDLHMYMNSYRDLVSLVTNIHAELDTPIMVSSGVISKAAFPKLAAAGADFYALYQETHNRKLFSRLRTAQNYDTRWGAKLLAHKAGLLIEEGILAGVGESPADIAVSLGEMGRIGADQMRVMSFVPQPGSPMQQYPPGDRTRELVIIALLRLMYPDILIPASLDVDGIAGLTARLNAGANVVTSIIPPHSGYRGVANGELDIDE